MRTESALTSEVLAHLRKLDPRLVVVKTNDRSTPGIPDVFICKPSGFTVWIEVKRSTSANPNVSKMLTPTQTRTLTKMAALGVPYHVLVRTPWTWKVYNVFGFVMDLTPSSKETAEWLCL